MKEKIKFVLLPGLVLFGWGSMPANAQLWSWATETAISRFVPEDIELLKTTAGDALNNHPDDTELNWNNPDSGHSGSIKVFGTREITGQTCRQVLIKNNAKTVKGSAEYLLCRQDDGTWTVSASQ